MPPIGRGTPHPHHPSRRDVLGRIEDGVDPGCDLVVPLLSGVLVDERGAGSGVAQARHYFSCRSPSGGGQGPCDVAEVVEVKARCPGGRRNLGEAISPVRPDNGRALLARENQGAGAGPTKVAK